MKKSYQEYEKDVALQACILGGIAVIVGLLFFIISFFRYISKALDVSTFVFILVCIIIPICLITFGIILFRKGIKILK